MNLTNELFEKFPNCEQRNEALYSKDNAHRFYYFKSITDSIKKKATVIMINPSEKKKKTGKYPDSTLGNLFKILGKEHKFSCFEVLNLQSQIDPKLNNLKNSPHKEMHNLNSKIIEFVVERSELIIPAWGVEEKFDSLIRDEIKKIAKICKEKNIKVQVIVNKFPCHFSPQCTSLSRNPELIDYEIKGGGF